MTRKLAGFFARCEGVWPSSRAGRLWGMVGSWGRQRGCGTGWGLGWRVYYQVEGFRALLLFYPCSLRSWGVTIGGRHSSPTTRAQPWSPPTWQVGPSTPPPDPLHQRPRLSSNTPRAQPPFTFVGLPSASGAGQRPQPLDPPAEQGSSALPLVSRESRAGR